MPLMYMSPVSLLLGCIHCIIHMAPWRPQGLQLRPPTPSMLTACALKGIVLLCSCTRLQKIIQCTTKEVSKSYPLLLFLLKIQKKIPSALNFCLTLWPYYIFIPITSKTQGCYSDAMITRRSVAMIQNRGLKLPMSEGDPHPPSPPSQPFSSSLLCKSHFGAWKLVKQWEGCLIISASFFHC